MPFDTTRYLSWYVPRVRGDGSPTNLHASGVPPLEPEDLDVPDGNPWLAALAFEAALARRLSCPPEEVLFTPGATGGTLLALLTLSQPGEEILVESPIYEPMLRQAERLSSVRRLRRDPGRGWRFDVGEARSLLADRTSLVMLTEPHNPSGVLSPREDVLALAEHAAEVGAILLVNEVYHGWARTPSYRGAAPNIVVASSLSKLLGGYWARLGWLTGDPSVIARLRRAHMNFGMASAPSAAVGRAVLQRADELTERARAAAREGADVVDGWVRRPPGLSWSRPDFSGFGCVALPPGTDDMALAEKLHQEHDVLVVPGSLWESPGSIRVSWLQCEPHELREGLARIAELLLQQAP